MRKSECLSWASNSRDESRPRPTSCFGAWDSAKDKFDLHNVKVKEIKSSLRQENSHSTSPFISEANCGVSDTDMHEQKVSIADVIQEGLKRSLREEPTSKDMSPTTNTITQMPLPVGNTGVLTHGHEGEEHEEIDDLEQKMSTDQEAL